MPVAAHRGVACGEGPLRTFAWLLAPFLFAACVMPPKGYFTATGVQVDRLDYSGWDALLSAHVHDGVVDYPGIAASAELRPIVDQLRRARLNQTVDLDERLAFLINAYNVSAIVGVLDGGSPATRWGRFWFFWQARHAVAGEEITLWDLEHRRIRTLGEPRIHFALVCASASCPKLASRVYRAGSLEDQLESAALGFVNDPSRNRFDSAQRVAHLSAIFEWYADDFGGAAGVPGYVARYVADPEVARSLAAGGWEIRTLRYDWSLNGVAPGGG